MKGRLILMLLLTSLAACPFCASESSLFEESDWTLGEEEFEVPIEADSSESPLFEEADWVFGQDEFDASDEAYGSDNLGPFAILSYLGGDGQEAMPGEELTSPFEVGLSSIVGSPVRGAGIRFTITEGQGELRSSDGTAIGSTIVVRTNNNGIAQCFCRLDGDLRVKAETLYSIRIPVPIWFSARASVAEEVAYDASGCAQVENAKTVQEAIDELCGQISSGPLTFSYVGGDGQGAMPGDCLPAPFQVRVSRGESPVEGAEIKFEILEGQGILDPANGSIFTGKDGIAQCNCCFEEVLESPRLRVRAMLIDVVSPDENGDPSHPAVIFNANAMVAEEVAYSPPLECLQLAGVETVGDAMNGLGRQVSFSYVGGDGQETMPGNKLPEPLRVRVARGSHPVTGATVKFKIDPGKGELRKDNGETGEELEVLTDEGGVATCFCKLDENAAIEARLMAPTPTNQSPIWFNAQVSVAEAVAFNPASCPNLQGARTVQQAIGGLCQMNQYYLACSMWTHGNGMQIEYPERTIAVLHKGASVLVVGAEDSDNWFHFAVPTPSVIEGERAKIGNATIRFKRPEAGSSEVYVDAVHIYDGEIHIAAFDNLNIQVPSTWSERSFELANRPQVQNGIGISVKVRFGETGENGQIEFSGAGCDFVR